MRGGYRSHVTKLTNKAKTEIDSEEASSIKTDQISVALKEKLKLLTAIDQEILLLVKDDEVEAEVLECEEHKSRTYGTIVELESKRSWFLEIIPMKMLLLLHQRLPQSFISHQTPLHQNSQIEFA